MADSPKQCICLTCGSDAMQCEGSKCSGGYADGAEAVEFGVENGDPGRCKDCGCDPCMCKINEYGDGAEAVEFGAENGGCNCNPDPAVCKVCGHNPCSCKK